MSRPLARFFSSSSRSLSLLGPIPSSSSSCSNPSKSASVKLAPLRYHIFKEPLPYPVGLKLQNDIIDKRLEAKAKDPMGSRGIGDVVLLLEHTPTYTTGRRDNSPNPNELHPEEKKVQNVGAEFYITKRGGQVTYHGPGQLVGYPILDLNVMETSTRCYVEYLQRMLGDYVRQTSGLGETITAPHPDGHVGVFSSPTEKVSSIGIHLRHRITSHGFAMNITPEPIKWFDLVMACGLADVHAISLHDLITRSAISNGVIPTLPSVANVAEDLVPKFGELFGREIISLHDEGGEGAVEEVMQIRELVKKAEEEAKEENAKSGGWATEPDLSKRG
ncbi:lipoyl(octanoyl) transferase [Kwoniella shandongensis]|uniref:lipoyl(octanoyl) transferase n=1 Tax=Kwoniella shandongensis TaxID=1734106 RepID=A0A5M6C7Y7_9TREE|nr:lipoyl(octanoyl) transferase [Kwoniella shandongensis]KAA5530991.1 lipoyl(octanoyl) transferase [Kwoniella shandongensis]